MTLKEKEETRPQITSNEGDTVFKHSMETGEGKLSLKKKFVSSLILNRHRDRVKFQLF
jgi:hypothetical protein